jgi:ribose/xylose/arabinose/galactoside ABC-type transport system permease subunit
MTCHRPAWIGAASYPGVAASIPRKNQSRAPPLQPRSPLAAGTVYLLTSIAVVIIGGTAVAGGNGNTPGIWGASLFMFLVVSMLNTYGASAGVRLVLTGVIIIAVIVAASRRRIS